MAFEGTDFGNIKNPGQPEKPLVGFSQEELEKNNNMENADSDYVKYLLGDMSIADDPEDSQHKLFLEDVGDDLTDDNDDDPQYKLFFSSLKKHGSSYVLQVDGKNGLTKPLKYEQDESDDEGQEDLDCLSVTQWRESEIEDDYALFPENLSLEGPNAINDNGLSLTYNLPNFQTYDGTSSRKRKSKLSIHEAKPLDSSKEDINVQCGSPRRKVRSKFRVQIMRILCKPYDDEEHKMLMQAITVQKGQNRHIDLRSGRVKFCSSNKKGKSYLDHHGDLKRKVQAVDKDDHKQLNLLRGFFFWIQNLTQEGSFIPWNDKECLAVQPQDH